MTARSAPPVVDLRVAGRGLYLRSGKPAWLGLGTILAFIGIMGLWSALAPLSGAAIANGNLRAEGQRRAVQHPYGGVIQRLLVQEGAEVVAGQVLAVLSEIEPKAQHDVLLSERDALRAEEARLVAERDGRDQPDFGLLGERSDLPNVTQAIASETALLAARRKEIGTRLDVLRQRAAQLGEQKSGLKAQIAGLERQTALLEEEASGARQLLSSGYTPKTRVLALERDAARLEADRGLRLAEVGRVDEAIGGAKLEIAGLEQSRMTEVTTRLREVQSRLAGLEPRVASAQDILRRTQILAPASGAVVGLTVFTEGGVVQAGAKLMEIVPSSSPLVVDGRLPLTSVADVAVGSQADIRLTGFHLNERPAIRGEVVVVSADRLTDERTGVPYYAVTLRLNDEDVRGAGVALQSGMPAEAVIPTRGRTVLEYLAGPLLDELSGAMREK